VKPWTAPKLIATCAASLLFWAGIAILCMYVSKGPDGSYAWAWPRDPFIRAERSTVVLVASLIGAALSSAGVAYQAVLRNPLAEPYLLGVSGGAMLAGYLAAVSAGSALGLQSAAFIGAITSLAFVLLLSQRRGRIEPVTLLLVGVIVSSICGAVYLFIYHFNLRREISFGTGGVFRFLVGGINTNLTPRQIQTAAAIIAAGWLVLLYLTGELNVATLSEAEAQALGVRIHRLRWIALITASLVTASAVAISGPIGFIGLVCPHVARLLVGADQRRLLPVATAFGAALLASADALSRGLSHQTYGPLPVGIITGLLGGPFFLSLLWRRRAMTARGN
jgi:iron complex transport system permease protein